jgi:hypothetical protein
VAIVLTYHKPGHDLSALHDELLAAIPALAPVPGPDGPVPVMAVEGEGPTVRLTVPDGTDTGAVDAVVAAHVPQTPYDPTAQAREVAAVRRRERVRGDYDSARALVAAATTVEELRAATLAALDRLQRR